MTLHARVGRLRYYALALLLVAAGVMVRIGLNHWVGPGLPTYLTFSPFVILAALIGGLGPGLLATLATAVVVSYWLLPPAGVFKIASTPDAVGLVFFCVMGLFVSVVAALYRRTRDHLGELVVARTTALRVANARLQTQAETLQAQTQKLTAAEATLRRSESHLAQAQQIARVGSWSWDMVADRLSWSDEMYRLYGLEPGECVARHNDFLRFVHPEDRPRVETFAREALGRGHYSTDYRIIRTDGAERHVHSEGETTFDDQGHPVRAEGILQDITERKRVEEVLKIKDSAIASSLNAIAMADLKGCLTYVNPAFLKLWGYDDPQQILGRSVLDFWKQPQQALEVKQAIQSGQGWEGELVAVRRDGSQLDLHLFTNTVLDDQGVPICMMASFVDVTERKRAVEALRESEERLHLALQSARMGMWDWDVSTGQGRVTPQNQRLFGLPEDMLELTEEDYSSLLHLEDAPRVRQALRSVARTGGHYEEQYRIRRPDGAERWIQSEGHLVNLPDGHAHFIGVSYDITARKQAEETLREWNATLEGKVAQRTTELRQRARQLQKLTLDMSEAEDRERKRLAAILHDDLQQIIAAAKFHLSVMRNRIKDNASLAAIGEEIDQMLKEAVEKSRGLSHELSPAALDHGDFAEALDQLARQMQAQHGLTVQVRATGQVPLQSDTVKAFIYRAAQELLFNAVKHAQVEEAKIRVRRLGRCLCLTVSDHGRGFDPQELREAAGFGLLSIQERIELLGGRMKIRSARGKGSKFFIVVPDGETAAVE